MSVKTVCVFCGSTPNVHQDYFDHAIELGKALAANEIHLVYGGGVKGLMGALAQATYEAGGRVTGIIPETLYRISQQSVGELVIVKDMHSRKALMNEKSDAFIALPGGFGTLEELLEVTTWSQLNIHTKPIVCLNTRGYWNGLLDLVRNCVQEGFITQKNEGIIVAAETVPALLQALEKYEPPEGRYGKLAWAMTTPGLQVASADGKGDEFEEDAGLREGVRPSDAI